MKSYYIHFIRHGAIDKCYGGKYIGVTDVSLSAEGKAQLEKLSSDSDYPYAKAVYCSPLKRCLETADIIYPDAERLVINELTEYDFGEWENKNADELRSDPDFSKWLAGDSSVKPPRGESNADFTRRVCLTFEAVINDMLRSGYTDIAVITHGGVIMTLLSVYGIPSAKPFDWVMDNGYGYSLRLTPMLWQRDKVLEVFDRIPKERSEDDD